jgi:hypothetical protein
MGPIEETDILGPALADLRDLAESAQAAEGREGVGVAADGLIRVKAAGGRITSVELDPWAMRWQAEPLAAAFAEAANAALDDLAGQYTGPELPAFDLEALQSQVAEAEVHGAQQLRSYLQTIADAMRQAR